MESIETTYTTVTVEVEANSKELLIEEINTELALKLKEGSGNYSAICIVITDR